MATPREQLTSRLRRIQQALGVTADGVLGSIYEVAGLSPPALAEEDIFRGHPLAAEPKGAAVLFYGIWPAAVGAAAFWHRRRNS